MGEAVAGLIRLRSALRIAGRQARCLLELALKEEDCYTEVYWISWDVKLSVIPVTSVLLKLGVLKLGVCNPYDCNFLNSLRQIEFGKVQFPTDHS